MSEREKEKEMVLFKIAEKEKKNTHTKKLKSVCSSVCHGNEVRKMSEQEAAALDALDLN